MPDMTLLSSATFFDQFLPKKEKRRAGRGEKRGKHFCSKLIAIQLHAAHPGQFLGMCHLDLGKPITNTVSVSNQRLNGMQLLGLSVSKPSEPALCPPPLSLWIPGNMHGPPCFPASRSSAEAQLGSWKNSIKREGRNPLTGSGQFPVYRRNFYTCIHYSVFQGVI